jgi:hypothetical protein
MEFFSLEWFGNGVEHHCVVASMQESGGIQYHWC